MATPFDQSPQSQRTRTLPYGELDVRLGDHRQNLEEFNVFSQNFGYELLTELSPYYPTPNNFYSTPASQFWEEQDSGISFAEPWKLSGSGLGLEGTPMPNGEENPNGIVEDKNEIPSDGNVPNDSSLAPGLFYLDSANNADACCNNPSTTSVTATGIMTLATQIQEGKNLNDTFTAIMPVEDVNNNNALSEEMEVQVMAEDIGRDNPSASTDHMIQEIERENRENPSSTSINVEVMALDMEGKNKENKNRDNQLFDNPETTTDTDTDDTSTIKIADTNSEGELMDTDSAHTQAREATNLTGQISQLFDQLQKNISEKLESIQQGINMKMEKMEGCVQQIGGRIENMEQKLNDLVKSVEHIKDTNMKACFPETIGLQRQTPSTERQAGTTTTAEPTLANMKVEPLEPTSDADDETSSGVDGDDESMLRFGWRLGALGLIPKTVLNLNLKTEPKATKRGRGRPKRGNPGRPGTFVKSDPDDVKPVLNGSKRGSKVLKQDKLGNKFQMPEQSFGIVSGVNVDSNVTLTRSRTEAAKLEKLPNIGPGSTRSGGQRKRKSALSAP